MIVILFMVEPGSTFDLKYRRWQYQLKTHTSLVYQFLKSNGIESTEVFYSCTRNAFTKDKKNLLSLSMVPTKNDLSKYGFMLTEKIYNDIQSFKEDSEIYEKFIKFALEQKLMRPEEPPVLGEKGIFKCNTLSSYYELYSLGGVIYVRAVVDILVPPTVEGIIEISNSDFHKIIKTIEA